MRIHRSPGRPLFADGGQLRVDLTRPPCGTNGCYVREGDVRGDVVNRRKTALRLALSDAGLEVGEDGAPRLRRPLLSGGARMPERPADLAGYECLRLARRHRLHDRWRFRAESGVEEIKVGGHLSSGSGDELHAWALEGQGLSLEELWDVE